MVLHALTADGMSLRREGVKRMKKARVEEYPGVAKEITRALHHHHDRRALELLRVVR